MKFILLLLTTLFFFAAYAEHPEKKSDKTYDEVYRPQFHFTPEKGILSTPAGLVFYSGEYHMFISISRILWLQLLFSGVMQLAKIW
jgi:hypothetical protein